MPLIAQHPFQKFGTLDNFRQGPVPGNEIYEDEVIKLNGKFERLVQDGNYFRFISNYIDSSKLMLKLSPGRETIYPILQYSLAQLLSTAASLRNFTRDHFSTDGSIFKFSIDTGTLEHARQQVDDMESRSITNEKYDLKSIPEFRNFAKREIQPVIDEFTGYRSVGPKGELRFHDSEKHSHRWSDVYRHHDFANYHFDRSIVAFPFIVYLDDVGSENGPFTYIDNTDKFKQNYILRAFHSVTTHILCIRGSSDEDLKALAKLPSVFFGGDLVGTFTGPSPFEDSYIKSITGPAGTALMFHGFNLVHSGGNPVNGTRKALFLNFRYPRAKIHRALSESVARLYWNPLTH